jgi:hypothetical protein
MAKIAPFPAFHEDRPSDILWIFDLDRIKAVVEDRKASGGKRAALAWTRNWPSSPATASAALRERGRRKCRGPSIRKQQPVMDTYRLG